jgi:hypothetical protein
VDKFFNDCTRGKFVGTFEEKQALEDEYTLALLENRIT